MSYFRLSNAADWILHIGAVCLFASPRHWHHPFFLFLKVMHTPARGTAQEGLPKYQQMVHPQRGETHRGISRRAIATKKTKKKEPVKSFMSSYEQL